MARMSHYAPGEYRPISMKFDGLTGGYIKEYTPVGQTMFAMGRFRIESFGGPSNANGVKTIVLAYGNIASNTRLHVFVGSASRVNPTENGRFGIHAHNSTGTTILFLFSKREVTDNAWHSFLVSWNATTGAFVFKLDGEDADDTTQPGRVASTGTMSTTAASLMLIGQNATGFTGNANNWSGELSHLACGNGYLTNWNDFFFPNNLPKRLDHVGWTELGAGVYAFPFVTLDGTTNYYGKTYTSTGNKVTTVVLFKIAPHTTNYAHLASCDGGAQARMNVVVGATDAASVNEQGKLVINCLNSVGGQILRLISPNVVNDNQWHLAFISFDGDLALSTFYMDGQNADDAASPTRVAATVGIMQSGATSRFGVGRSGSLGATTGKACSICYVGHRDAYMTNWMDFMTYDGKPREIDEDTWRQWRGQPRFWQSAAVMSAVNIKSSEGPMTQTGSIAVSAGSMPVIYHPFCDMENNLGLAGRMRRSGKCFPMVSGVPLRATKDASQNQGGVVLHWAPPRGVVSSILWDRSYFQQIPDGAITADLASGWSIDANGYAYKDLVWGTLMYVQNLPAKASTTRVYKLEFRFEDVAPPGTNPGLMLGFNIQDFNNWWRCIFYWNGSAWLFAIGDVIAGVWTVRATANVVTNVNVPIQGNISVFDGGDDLVGLLQLYEVDNPTDQYGLAINYSAASRLFKAATSIYITNHEDPDTNMRYRNFMVMDM